MTTSTDTPIIAIVIQGNHKERLKQWKYCYVASYESPFDFTLCMVKTAILNNVQRRKTMRDIEKEVKQITGSEPASMIYFQGGADVSTVYEFMNISMN